MLETIQQTENKISKGSYDLISFLSSWMDFSLTSSKKLINTVTQTLIAAIIISVKFKQDPE